MAFYSVRGPSRPFMSPAVTSPMLWASTTRGKSWAGSLMTLGHFGFLATPVPEPGSFIMLGTGLVALLWRGSRRPRRLSRHPNRDR